MFAQPPDRSFDHAADFGSPAGPIGSSTSAIGFAGRDLERRIDAELAQRPDLERFVRRLATEADLDLSEFAEDEDMLDDLEQYLQRLQDDDEDD